MSVLDELKKEAQEVEAARSSQETVRSALQRQTLKAIMPHMRRAHAYFSEFARHMSVVDRDIRASLDLRGFGVLGDLRQGDYKVTVDQPEVLERFQFRFVCARSGTVEVPRRDASSSAEYRDYLKAHGLRAKQRDTGKGSSVFVIEPSVQVVLDFRVDLDREAVLLSTRNLIQLGTTRYTLGTERLSPKLLDELAKVVMRRPNEFDDILGNRLTETGIFRIREKLHAQTAAGVPVAGEVAVSPPAAKPPGLGSRLLGAIRRR